MPWELITNVTLKFIYYIIQKRQASREARESYLAFINNLESEGLAAVSLNDDDRLQVDELNKRRKELETRGQNGDS